MLQIRTADNSDYSDVRDFYYSLIDAMADAEYKPGWQKDIYPAQEFLISSIKSKELYIGEMDRQIVSCMVVNHKYNDGYKDIQWSVEVSDSELFVIHALGVNPMFSGKGIAKQMVQQVIKIAHENNIKTIRLDVLEGNTPAERAYIKIGFMYLDTIQMFYDDTGWTNYKLFEFIV
ncbi:MAG: GNAT family N-acetyltransferase [Eubacteriales Family XIII. Incertae Sedis bacterium]|nr:MAG: GNAT family N-acetyltransferase [Clostridiales Family XIII bacterium]